MRTGRWIAVLVLIAACGILPATRAVSQEKKKTVPDDPPAAAATDKAVEALKKELDATKAKLTAAEKKAAETDKAAADAKAKADAAEAEAKKAAAAVTALAKDVAAAKDGGLDTKKTTETLTKLEKSAEAVTELGKKADELKTAASNANDEAQKRGDTAWMLTSSALVMLMVPGLALFYCGMVRRKNVLATMMQSMACLAVVGVYWVAVGYSLAFGPSLVKIEGGGLVGWSWDLFFLQGVTFDKLLPNNKISVLTHVMFQGMFAIITPALISGAIAERIRFWPFCIFVILWVTFVYCPLAHMVWAFDWFYDVPTAAGKALGESPVGYLGKMGALDFAGGTVVHIAAGLAGLACVIVLRKRSGYPEHVAHPNSMVLTVLGAGLLWFGWFGFNGGSAGNASPLAGAAFAATQAAAATAGLTWMVVEWIAKGKPTGLGLASGIVAGLVAVTPASGYIYVYGGVAIGAAAAVVCYLAVAVKNKIGYDDSLDAFGVHGVGGFVGAVLTGLFCSSMINGGADGYFSYHWQENRIKALEAGDKKLITDAQKKAAELKVAVDARDAEIKPKRDKADELTGKIADAKKANPMADVAALEAELAAVKQEVEDFEKKELAEAKTPFEAADTKAKDLEKELSTLTDLKKKRDDEKQTGGKKGPYSQLMIQLKAAGLSLAFALVGSLVLALVTQAVTGGNFTTTAKAESEGLDRTEHGEVGFDFGYATESVPVAVTDPKPASVPPGNGRYELVVEGAEPSELVKVWTGLCQPSEAPADADFLAVYPYVTTVQGNRFRVRSGDPTAVAGRLAALFKKQTGKPVTVTKA
jgi:ammonium transporter